MDIHEGNSKGKILFHATGVNAGARADSVNIQAPSFDRPFFVGDTVEMAQAYIDTFGYRSVWVFTTDKDLNKISFDFRNPGDLSRLEKWLPETIRWFRKQKSRSFFNMMWDLAKVVEDNFDLHSGRMVGEDVGPDMLEILSELDALDDENGLETRLGRWFLGKVRSIGADDVFDSVRRALKYSVYKILNEELDYLVVKDESTVVDQNTSKWAEGHEYAVLDGSVLRAVWDFSVGTRHLDEVLRKVEEGSLSERGNDLETMPLEDLGEMVLKEDEDHGKVKRDKRITSRDIRCPLCGEVTKGRRGLNMHLRRTHFSHDERRTGVSTMAKALGNKTKKDWSRERFDPRNELKIQKVLVSAVFGPSKVKEAEDGYVSGKYTMKTLPIDISYYLRLKGVKPERKAQDDAPNEDPKIQATKLHEVSVSELLDWLGKTPDDGSGTWSETTFGLKLGKDSYQYVVDLNVDVSEKVLKITSGNDEGSMLKATDAIGYLNRMIEDETLDPVWKVIHGRSAVRKVIQKTDGDKRWLILDPGSDEEEK